MEEVWLFLMSGTFILSIEDIQPSQLYISRDKLQVVLRKLERDGIDSLEPIPIKRLDGELVSTDGHTRLFALYTLGLTETKAEWEDIELNWEAYRICVQWCKEEGITSIAGLEGRVIDSKSYETLWLKRCKIMHEALAVKGQEE